MSCQPTSIRRPCSTTPSSTHPLNLEHLPPGMLLVPLVLLALPVDVLQGPLHIVLVAESALVLLPRGKVIVDGDIAVLACPLLARDPVVCHRAGKRRRLQIEEVGEIAGNGVGGDLFESSRATERETRRRKWRNRPFRCLLVPTGPLIHGSSLKTTYDYKWTLKDQ